MKIKFLSAVCILALLLFPLNGINAAAEESNYDMPEVIFISVSNAYDLNVQTVKFMDNKGNIKETRVDSEITTFEGRTYYTAPEISKIYDILIENNSVIDTYKSVDTSEAEEYYSRLMNIRKRHGWVVPPAPASSYDSVYRGCSFWGVRINNDKETEFIHIAVWEMHEWGDGYNSDNNAIILNKIFRPLFYESMFPDTGNGNRAAFALLAVSFAVCAATVRRKTRT